MDLLVPQLHLAVGTMNIDALLHQKTNCQTTGFDHPFGSTTPWQSSRQRGIADQAKKISTNLTRRVLRASLTLGIAVAPMASEATAMQWSQAHSAPNTLEDRPAIQPPHPLTMQIPQGWRRTANGWEDSSRWAIPAAEPERSIDQWITLHAEQKPTWAKTVFQFLRSQSPITIAVAQILLITWLTRIGRTNPTTSRIAIRQNHS